ncbi:MAG: PIN domain-containing protein [Chloroflexi bacterium]|nr:PIN domain-containing protein [Chloroflexota bacterium]
MILPGKRRFREVFALYVNNGLSFVDAYHLVLMKQLKLTEIVTFDKRIERMPGIKRIEPEE